jgi:peptidyl-prolyl cis-trans isomerase D
MSAPMFELQLKNRELQKHLFDFIGAGTITPDFLTKKKFEDENKSLNLEYFAMENLYKKKENFTDNEINKFLDQNKDQLKKEYIDFKYAELNPKILIGLEEFNQDFFDEIDRIENKISNGDDFQSIIQNIKTDIKEIKEFTPSSTKKINEDLIYSKRSTEIDLIESGDSFLLYSITKKYDLSPDITNQNTKNEIKELAYQKEKFDLNRSVLEEIQNKKFDDNKFKEMAGNNKEYSTISSIEDDNKFETSSVKMLYSLPINSYTLVSDEDDKIYLVKLVSSKKNTFSETDENYLSYVSRENTNTRKSIIQSYDQLLNSKYQVQLNQKTIDRVKNYFK